MAFSLPVAGPRMGRFDHARTVELLCSLHKADANDANGRERTPRATRHVPAGWVAVTSGVADSAILGLRYPASESNDEVVRPESESHTRAG